MYYNGETKEIGLEAGASLYALAHERAHQIQDQHQTRTWRLHQWVQGVPILSGYTRFLVELQAAKMAKRALIALEAWRAEHQREMLSGLASYLIPRIR